MTVPFKLSLIAGCRLAQESPEQPCPAKPSSCIVFSQAACTDYYEETSVGELILGSRR